MTFNEVATEWYGIHSVGLSTSTRQGYLYDLSHIQPSIGTEEITAIKYGELQRILNTKASEGYSQRTVTGLRNTMIMVLNHAIKSEYTEKNPAFHTQIPHFTKCLQDKCISVLEAELVQKFKHKYQLFVLTLLFTGVRRGEALALTWEDVDCQNNILTISKAVEFVGNKPFVKSPKTVNSYRSIPIPAPLMKLFVKSRTANPSDLIFTQLTTGRPHTQTSYKKMWQCWYNDFQKYYFEKTATQAQHITAHMLRHYYITYLFENNIPDIMIQRVAGHAEISFTRKRYTHIRQHFQEQCFKNILNLYS